MRRELPLLNSISVAKPCSANWDEMSGDEKKRFCGHCQKHVHNLSAMNGKEAEKLLQNSPNLCVRYSTDSKRKPLTRWQLRRKNAWSWLGACLAVLVSGPYGCRQPDDVMGDPMVGKLESPPSETEPGNTSPTTPPGKEPKVVVKPGQSPEIVMGEMPMPAPDTTMGMVAPNEVMGRRAMPRDRPEPR